MWSLAAAVGSRALSSGKPRRRRPTSSGPKRGKPTRRVTDPTSRAAIRRSEARRGIRTTGPKPPTSRGPRKPSRTINTGSKRPRRLSSRTTRTAIARSESRRPKRTTSQAAIARFKARRKAASGRQRTRYTGRTVRRR